MNKRICLFLAAILLSGCTATVGDQSRMFDDQGFHTQSGTIKTVSELKNDYLVTTGHLLNAEDTLSCGWDGDCYYNKWANAYDKGMSAFYERNKLEQERQAREEQARVDAENAACNASPQCVKEKKVAEYSNQLNYQYRLTMALYPYSQADFDMAIRTLCRNAGAAQRNGVPLETVQKNIRLVEGMDPQTRASSVIIATACWRLSQVGISDGTEQIN